MYYQEHKISFDNPHRLTFSQSREFIQAIGLGKFEFGASH